MESVQLSSGVHVAFWAEMEVLTHETVVSASWYEARLRPRHFSQWVKVAVPHKGCTIGSIIDRGHIPRLSCCNFVKGHSRGEGLIGQPRAVSALMHRDCTVLHVACSEAATVVATSRGDVFALYRYQCRRIISKYDYCDSSCNVWQHICDCWHFV